jgi:hypothetical protein
MRVEYQFCFTYCCLDITLTGYMCSEVTLNVYDGLEHGIRFLFQCVVSYRCTRFEKLGSKCAQKPHANKLIQ